MPSRAPTRPTDDPVAALRRSLERSAPAPVYLLHGTETLLLERAERLIAAAAAAGGGPETVDRQVYAGAESAGREVALAASAYPMLGMRRLVIVRDAEKLAEPEALEPYLGNPSPSTTLVLIARAADFRTAFFRSLKAAAETVECRTPYEERLGAWIEGEAAAAGRSIEPEGVELLRRSAGGSLAELAGELEKLYLFAAGRTQITAADVAAVVSASRRHSIFDLQRAIGAGDAGAALRVIGGMIDSGEAMTRCVAQLAAYLEKLWLLPASGTTPADAAALLGVKPFFAGEYIAARRNFTPGRLDRAFLALRDADRALKSSSGSPLGIMTVLVHALTRDGATPSSVGR